MEDEHTGASRADSRIVRWWRAFRPLVAWLLLVAVLFGIRTHARLLQKTRIVFELKLEGQGTAYASEVTLDGRPFSSGEKVGLGKHQLIVTHPKADQITSNLFILYGERNLGTIKLKRTRGTVAIQVRPPAARLSVVGPEFSLTLDNSSGMTSAVPTDAYRVSAEWANFSQAERITVTSGGGLTRLTPSLGDLSLQSEPAGASVRDQNGRTLGETPITLRELPSGQWSGELRLENHIPAVLRVSIGEGKTNTIHTNLVNWRYSQAMEKASAHVAEEDYDRALEAVSAALHAVPNDNNATALKKEATIARHLKMGTALLEKADYNAARQELAAILTFTPDHPGARTLLNEITKREEDLRRRKELARAEAEKQREAELVEKARQERLNRPKEHFRTWMKTTLNSELFDENIFEAKGTLKEIEAKLLRSLTNGPSAFEKVVVEYPDAQTFRLRAKQNLKTSGWRRCDLIAGQTTEGDVSLVYKVFEYTYVEAFSVRAWIGEDDEKKMVPVHASRLAANKVYLLPRRTEGKKLVADRIHETVNAPKQ